MTLATNLIVRDPISPRSVFDHALELIARDFEGEPTWNDDGRRYQTTLGQGLAGILTVTYATDGPLEPDEDDPHRPPFDAFCVRVNVDTAYGYQADNGAGCEDLHAWFVAELSRWLAERGVTAWAWQDEYTGAWFGPDDPITVLGDPMRGELPGRAGARR